MAEKRLTSYRGLYCLDCVPSKKCLFENLEKFQQQLEEVALEKYALLKSSSNPTFNKYPYF